MHHIGADNVACNGNKLAHSAILTQVSASVIRSYVLTLPVAPL